MKYPAYPEYIDSGFEWIGEIPKGWSLIQIKHLAQGDETLFLDGDWIESGDIVSDDTQIRYITTGNIGVGQYKEQGGGYITQETFVKLNCTEIFPDDLLISRLNPPIGRCCLIPDLGKRIVTSVDNVVLRPSNNFYKPFLKYVMSSHWYFEYTSLIARGATMQRISRGLLGDVKLSIPSNTNEQQAIADFLDTKTALIDDLIAKKERQIELMKEKRTALINKAVTKGLKPDVPLKDSGIEWLGEIPSHWEVIRLKFLKTEPLMYGANEAAEQDDPDQPRFIRITDINEDGNLREETFKSLPEDVALPYLLKDGDVLLARSGATVGKAFLYSSSWGRACFAGYLIKFSPNQNKIYPELFKFFTETSFYKDLIINSTIQATIQNVSAEKYANLFQAVPPLPEQYEIVQYISLQAKQISTVISKLQTQISKLREYRQTLITAAVTGKIDVREAVSAY